MKIANEKIRAWKTLKMGFSTYREKSGTLLPIGVNLSQKAHSTVILPHTLSGSTWGDPKTALAPQNLPSPGTGRGDFVVRQKRGGVTTA
ncbi:hypothetical protein LC653_09025 [Nostoc sp. CHAB 5784]|uniref:hypothetical protein n=1 Tax=Nostoc mirabile TaxID=2907820 RepID=UPI001E491D5F|nr:hypothetical protein [Nostoc mirabile]MCC5664058.1 hypothetical protein [Nostoc mirabile CHAB5784]